MKNGCNFATVNQKQTVFKFSDNTDTATHNGIILYNIVNL